MKERERKNSKSISGSFPRRLHKFRAFFPFLSTFPAGEFLVTGLGKDPLIQAAYPNTNLNQGFSFAPTDGAGDRRIW